MKIDNKKKEIIGIILVLPLVLFLLNENKVILIYPDKYSEISQVRPEFLFSSGFEKYRILVDDNSDFSSPLVDNVIDERKYSPNFDLDFGKYYWKVIGFKDEKAYLSKTSSFEINSLVLVDSSGDTIRNIGNAPVSIKQKISQEGAYNIVGYAVLDVGEFVRKNQTVEKIVIEQI